jgi:hypothetical protein
MNHQGWIKLLPTTLLLCCALAPLLADDKPAAPLQKQKAAEHVIQIRETFTTMVLPDTQFYCDTRLKLAAKWGNEDLRRYFFKQTE